MSLLTNPQLWKSIGAKLASGAWRGTKATGRGLRKTAGLGAAGAIGLGVNPWLGLALGNAVRNLGKGGGGAGGAGAGAGGLLGRGGDPAAQRDSSIIAGMKPHSPMQRITIGKLSSTATMQEAMQYTAKASRASYLTSLQNNKELIYIQNMLQGPTAARAKELRMESGKGGAPVIIMGGGGGEGGGRGGGLGSLLPFAAVAGILAALAALGTSDDDKSDPEDDAKTTAGAALGTSGQAIYQTGRSTWRGHALGRQTWLKYLKENDVRLKSAAKVQAYRDAYERAVRSRSTGMRSWWAKYQAAKNLQLAEAAHLKWLNKMTNAADVVEPFVREAEVHKARMAALEAAEAEKLRRATTRFGDPKIKGGQRLPVGTTGSWATYRPAAGTEFVDEGSGRRVQARTFPEAAQHGSSRGSQAWKTQTGSIQAAYAEEVKLRRIIAEGNKLNQGESQRFKNLAQQRLAWAAALEAEKIKLLKQSGAKMTGARLAWLQAIDAEIKAVNLRNFAGGDVATEAYETTKKIKDAQAKILTKIRILVQADVVASGTETKVPRTSFGGDVVEPGTETKVPRTTKIPTITSTEILDSSRPYTGFTSFSGEQGIDPYRKTPELRTSLTGRSLSMGYAVDPANIPTHTGKGVTAADMFVRDKLREGALGHRAKRIAQRVADLDAGIESKIKGQKSPGPRGRWSYPMGTNPSVEMIMSRLTMAEKIRFKSVLASAGKSGKWANLSYRGLSRMESFMAGSKAARWGGPIIAAVIAGGLAAINIIWYLNITGPKTEKAIRLPLLGAPGESQKENPIGGIEGAPDTIGSGMKSGVAPGDVTKPGTPKYILAKSLTGLGGGLMGGFAFGIIFAILTQLAIPWPGTGFFGGLIGGIIGWFAGEHLAQAIFTAVMKWQDFKLVTAANKAKMQMRTADFASRQGAVVENIVDRTSTAQGGIGTGVSKNWDFPGGKFPVQGTYKFDATRGSLQNYKSVNIKTDINKRMGDKLFGGEQTKSAARIALATLKTKQQSLGKWFETAGDSGALGGAWGSSGGTLQDHLLRELHGVQIAINKLSTIIAPLPNQTNSGTGGSNTTAASVSVEGDTFQIFNNQDDSWKKYAHLGQPNAGLVY